jgi:hypothetical protein
VGSLRRVRLIPDRLNLFGPPLLLDGEDRAVYDELSARVRAAVEPADTIEEMFVAEVVWHVWEILRYRRLKSCLMRACGIEEMKKFLSDNLDYEDYREEFEQSLATSLEEYLSKHEAKMLAQQCAQGEEAAVHRVNQLLPDEQSLDTSLPRSWGRVFATQPALEGIRDRARASRAGELAKRYAQQDAHAVKKVDKLLASSAMTLDKFLMDGLIADDQACLTTVERIDRLIIAAESRRNNSLHEIDRHRQTLGKALRRTLENIDKDGPPIIEAAPSYGKGSRRHE